MTQQDTTIISLKPGEAKWFNIYEPAQPDSKGRPMYDVTIPGEYVPIDLDVRRSRTGNVKLRSIFRPEVKIAQFAFENGRALRDDIDDLTDQLVLELQRLDARNLPRDHVFVDRGIDVEFYPGTHVDQTRKEEYTVLVLQSVTVYL